MRTKVLATACSALFIVALIALSEHVVGFSLPLTIERTLRWLVLFFFATYAWRARSLTPWILVSMAAGVELGHDWPAVALKLEVLGTIFLRLIKVIIAPLLFGTLVVGIGGHNDLKKVRRLGIKALVYFEIVSTLALLIGFAAITVSRAGVGVRMTNSVGTEPPHLVTHKTAEVIANFFPENIAKSVAEGQVLQIVIFSVLFGVALALVPEPKRNPMLQFASSLSETMFKLTNIIMLLAPIGVFGATSYTVAKMGLNVLLPLLKVLITMYVALGVFVFTVLLPIAVVAGIPLVRFLKAVAEPVTIAFATASSEAALPRAIEQMESLGVPRETVAFVLPIGYSFNLDGSSLYQAIALIFVAQAAGLHLTASQQIAMLLTLLVSSKGVAGVARASLVVVLAVATSFQLPYEPLFLLFGIDQLMDMARTGVNVLGNCLATVVIARWDGEM